MQNKTKNYFDALAGQWDSMVNHNPVKIETFLNLMGLAEGLKILDVGTGTGVMIPHLLKRRPASIVAIDLSEKMLDVAREKYAQEIQAKKVSFQAVDFYELSAAEFDVVIVYSAYPHFQDKPAFVNKLSRCLGEGGRFMVAHSESRDTINHRHSGDSVKKVSEGLKTADIEATYFEPCFTMDIKVDTSEYYLLSGCKK